jgi:hypothetical protein
MDIFLGVVFLVLIGYAIRGVHRFLTTQPAPQGRPTQVRPPAVSPTDTRTLEQRLEDREDEAFIDGLIIGSYFFGDFWDRGDDTDEVTMEELDLWYDDATEFWDDVED